MLLLLHLLWWATALNDKQWSSDRSRTPWKASQHNISSSLLADRQTYKQTDRQTDKHTCRHTGRQTDRRSDRQTQTDWQTGGRTDRRTDWQTDRQAVGHTDREPSDRQADGQTDERTDGQSDRHRYIYKLTDRLQKIKNISLKTSLHTVIHLLPLVNTSTSHTHLSQCVSL